MCMTFNRIPVVLGDSGPPTVDLFVNILSGDNLLDIHYYRFGKSRDSVGRRRELAPKAGVTPAIEDEMWKRDGPEESNRTGHRW